MRTQVLPEAEAVPVEQPEVTIACNVCGRTGGTGARGKLRVLLRRYAELALSPAWANPSWDDGHVHAECYLDQQLILSRRH